MEIKEKTQTEIVTKTVAISTTMAVGLVSASAVFAFSLFWNYWWSPPTIEETVTVEPTRPPSLRNYTQQLAGYALAYQANPSNPGLAAQLEQIAKKRQIALLKQADQDPVEARANLMSSDLSTGLPESVRGFIEQAVTEEGTLELMHYDVDMEAGITRHEAFLLAGDRRTRLYTDDLETLEEAANTKVKVRGARLNDSAILLADTANDSGGTDAAVEVVSEIAAVTLAERKVAVILFNFVNDPRQNQTPEQVRGIVFTGSKSTNTYDQEVSFGQLQLVGKLRTDGDVFGWYTLPETYNNSTQSCSSSYRTWSNAARQMAIDAGVDLTGYDHFIYVMPPTGYCPGAGWAEVKADESWISGTGVSFGIVTHEHGHNLGTWHASSNTCVDASGQRVQASTSCTMAEYGDPFDIMGSSSGGRHLSLAHKHQVGWLPPARVLDVTTDGVYTITPNEELSQQPMALRIPRDKNSTGQVARAYWIEYRKTFGTFDNFSASDPAVNGVMIRSARLPNVSGGGTSNTLLFDSSVGTNHFSDAPLPVGQTFDDPAFGLRFETVAIRPGSADVRVTFVPAVCVRGEPTITITNPSSILGTAGQTLNYSVAITNTDSSACPSSTLNLSSVLPAGWTQTSATTALTLNPGQIGYIGVGVRSASDAVPGTYNFTETATHATSGLSKSATGTYTVVGPDVTAPVVTITSPVSGSSVKGKNVKLTASASDASGIATITLKLNGTTVKTCTNVSSCSHTVSLSAGSYTLVAAAVDASPNANTGTASASFTKR